MNGCTGERIAEPGRPAADVDLTDGHGGAHGDLGRAVRVEQALATGPARDEIGRARLSGRDDRAQGRKRGGVEQGEARRRQGGDGVRHGGSTSSTRRGPGASSSRGARHRVAPAASAVNTSETDASKLSGANCRITLSASIAKVSICAVTRLARPPCGTITPLGAPGRARGEDDVRELVRHRGRQDGAWRVGDLGPHAVELDDGRRRAAGNRLADDDVVSTIGAPRTPAWASMSASRAAGYAGSSGT